MTRTWRPRLAVAMWIVVLGLHIVGTSAQGTIREADGNQALTFVSPPPDGDGARPATHSWGPDSGRSTPHVRVPKSVQFSMAPDRERDLATEPLGRERPRAEET